MDAYRHIVRGRIPPKRPKSQITSEPSKYTRQSAAVKPTAAEIFTFFAAFFGLVSTATRSPKPPIMHPPTGVVIRPFRAVRRARATVPPESRGAERARTANLLVANQALSQLSYGPVSIDRAHYRPRPTKNAMGPRGFEPRTSSLSATRSNQLSYEPSSVVSRLPTILPAQPTISKKPTFREAKKKPPTRVGGSSQQAINFGLPSRSSHDPGLPELGIRCRLAYAKGRILRWRPQDRSFADPRS